MSRNAKIVLVIAGTLFAMCCMFSVAAILLLPKLAENTFTQDPQKAHQVGLQIADYTIPAGYSEQFSMDILTTKMVMIEPASTGLKGTGGLLFMLMQISQPGISREQMEAQMRQSFQQQFQRSSGPMIQVGTEQVIIKGQPVTLTIYEGKNTSTGALTRQELGVFPGKGGTAMLMIFGAVSAWDRGLISDFLNSFR